MFAASKTAAPVSAAKYIEDVFSVWLRTGTGANATITTNLDASTNKSLVWTKSRSAATDHKFTDTVRGATKALISNTTGAQTTDTTGLTAFSSTGYTIGTSTTYNNSGATYVDWQFVATPKFFDVVTYTGNGVAGRTVSHNLGSVPGCIIVKRTDAASTYGWCVYHRSSLNLVLNSTAAAGATFNGEISNPTSTTFTVSSLGDVNSNGGTYVAYLFAHDAGGFGAAGTDNVISCGSFTTDGSGNATVTLNYEPQWILLKKSSAGAEDWYMFDSMRGIATGGVDAQLNPNLSAAEASTFNYINLTATGFGAVGQSSSATYIYIAIRRGPMRTPTSGTSVFSPNYSALTSNPLTLTTGFPVDMQFCGYTNYVANKYAFDRLRGASTSAAAYLLTSATNAEATSSASGIGFQSNTSFTDQSILAGPGGAYSAIYWNFRRAPGFFDVVCYTGTGVAARSVSHNLAVPPELVIVKRRDAGTNPWRVLSTVGPYLLRLDATNAGASSSAAIGGYFGNDSTYTGYAPTSTVFYVSSSADVNQSASTYVAYLFASVTGVSKVGSYTGNGSSQTINCGFAAGARFVMIKRTDSTGDWYVWDTARGMVAGNDPHLSLNTTAADVTTDDSVDTDSSGFIVNQVAATNVNVTSATYIFLAIA